MKTTRILTILMGLASIFIISCQKTDSLKTEEPSGKASGIVIVHGAPIELADCWSTCINPEGPYIRYSVYKTQTWGNSSNPHWKTVNSFAYNTATSFVVEVTFTHSGGNSSNTVSVTALGSTQSIATLASGATHTFTFAIPAGWKACDNVPFSIYQQGQSDPMNMSYSYNLYEVCDSDVLRFN